MLARVVDDSGAPPPTHFNFQVLEDKLDEGVAVIDDNDAELN